MLFPRKEPGTVAVSIPLRSEGGPIEEEGGETRRGRLILSQSWHRGTRWKGKLIVTGGGHPPTGRDLGGEEEETGWRKTLLKTGLCVLSSGCLMLVNRTSTIIICCLFQTCSIGFHGSFSLAALASICVFQLSQLLQKKIMKYEKTAEGFFSSQRLTTVLTPKISSF